MLYNKVSIEIFLHCLPNTDRYSYLFASSSRNSAVDVSALHFCAFFGRTTERQWMLIVLKCIFVTLLRHCGWYRCQFSIYHFHFFAWNLHVPLCVTSMYFALTIFHSPIFFCRICIFSFDFENLFSPAITAGHVLS